MNPEGSAASVEPSLTTTAQPVSEKRPVVEIVNNPVEQEQEADTESDDEAEAEIAETEPRATADEAAVPPMAVTEPSGTEDEGKHSNRDNRSNAPHVYMLGLLFLGTLVAVGHHFFYSYLDTRELQGVRLPQAWVIRMGNAIAFLFKIALVSAIGIAYAQGFWFFVRRNDLRIESLDAMFGVLSNPLLFFNWQFLRKTWCLFILAAIVSIVPISAVLAPVTTREKWSGMNVTVPVLAVPEELPNNFTLFHQSAAITRVAYQVLVSGGLVAWPSPCGVNCSYSFSFPGPAYKCLDLGPLASLPVNFTELSSDWYNNPLPFPVNDSIYWWALDDSANNSSPIRLWIVYGDLNHTVRCTLYNSTYDVNVTYTNNIQVVQKNIKTYDTVLDGNDLAANFGTHFDVVLYMIHEGVVVAIGGWFADETGFFVAETAVDLWAGVTSYSNDTLISFPNDIPVEVHDFMANLTISLVTLQADSDPEISGLITQTSVPAIITTYPAVYTYSGRALWEIYGVALGVTVCCIAIGSFMAFKNGTTGQLCFSQVLIATRNPTLDRIAEAEDLYSVQKTLLRYGMLAGTEHECFGVPDEIMNRHEFKARTSQDGS